MSLNLHSTRRGLSLAAALAVAAMLAAQATAAGHRIPPLPSLGAAPAGTLTAGPGDRFLPGLVRIRPGWGRRSRSLQGVFGRPTRVFGFRKCAIWFDGRLFAETEKPQVYGMDTTVYPDTQDIYWQATFYVDGVKTWVSAEKSVLPVTQWGLAPWARYDGTNVLAYGRTVVVLHEFWWVDYRTGLTYYDYQWGPQSCSR
jgi:hypothetical protein